MEILTQVIRIEDKFFNLTYIEGKHIVVQPLDGSGARYLPWGDWGNDLAEAIIDLFNENF